MNLQEQKNIYLNRRERMNPELETTLKNGSLDLAKNPAFPKTDSNGNPINFLELIAYKRFNEVVDNSRRYNPNISASNIGELTRTLMEQAYSITDIEQPHLQKLEKLAVKLIVEQMEIPNDVFQYDVKIVPIGSISDENFQQQAQRPSAQDVEKVFGEQAEEENTTPTELFEMEKHKRRFINMLIQGASKKGHYMFVFVKNVLDLLNPQLTEKYGSMMSANDSIYWLFPDETLRRMSSQASSFAGKEEIDDTTDPPTLKVRGINFPVVVHELIKAIMEVFGTQGFPDDPKSAQMIMDSVDSLENEIMDLRLGAVIWELFLSSYPTMVFEEGSRHIQHYLFSRFCALEVNEFFRVARLILSQNQEGSKYMERMANEIVKDLQRQDYNSQFGDDEGYSLDDILGYADGGSVDNQIEIVVVAKELEKDGGNILKFRYLMAFDNEKQAIQHAKKMWIDEYDNSDLHIVEVLTADDYRQKYLQNKYDNGGNVKSSSVNKMMKYDTLVHYVTSNLDKGEKEYLGINAFSKEDAEKKAKIMFNQEDADRYDATIEYVSVWERGEAYKKGGSMYADSEGEANFDIYEWDDKMALINLDEIYEYAIKIDKMIDEDTDLEEWVKMKLTRIEQNIADVKHSLEGWEKYKSGGEISKKQLLHIAKYSKDLIEMIQGGSRLMSWQENKLAISSQSIDDIYHHLDYKMGNRAEDLYVKDEYAGGGEVGDLVEVELTNGKVIKGKIEKINPLKIRTDNTSTQVIPNPLVKSITKLNEYAGGGGIKKGFMVFNYTDNVYATDEVFKTKKSANYFIKEFRNRFSRQGYYRDNQMNKIAIEDIDLLAIPSDFNPFGKYAGGGGVKNKFQEASDYWKQLESQMTPKQKKFYSELLKRRQPSFEKNFNDSEIADYINGEIIEQFGVDLGIKNYQITGVNWFKLGFKYIAYREAIEEPEFWEEMNEYAGGGEIEDWMQSALYQLQAEEDNDNLQISFVKLDEFTCEDDDANEYRVFKNEDVAEQVAIEEVREMMEDEPQSFNSDFLMDFVDVGDFFVTDIEDGNYHYVQDIETESDSKYANRLIAELVQNGLISEACGCTRSSI